MKHVYKKLFLFIIFALFFVNQCCAEGFAKGTLVKVPLGYTKIEDLRLGDYLLCYYSDENIVEGKIVSVIKKTIDEYVQVVVGQHNICIACDQQMYDECSGEWIVAQLLKNGDILAGHTVAVELVKEPIDVYLLSVAQHHNFFVTKLDICAHNFFPPLVLVISAAFGLGAVEIAGISFGFAGLGTFLGYQWHKKSKQKHHVVIEPQFYGNGMVPEDPEDEKKRKRDELRANHKPLTNQEARDLAKNLGYREVKNHPCGNTHNKPVFTNGKDYISPDRTAHKGGVWKVFNRRGDRIATANVDFTVIIGT